MAWCLLVSNCMMYIKRPQFVNLLLRKNCQLRKNGGSVELKTPDGNSIRVCISPKLSNSEKRRLGISGCPRSIHIEGVLNNNKGRHHFVVYDPTGGGKINNETFVGIDKDPMGLSLKEYIGMNKDEFYTLIQTLIIDAIKHMA